MFSNGATLGDIDGDGDLDAFIAGYSLMRSEVFLNDGAGHFSQHINAYPSTERVDHVSFGDLDGDGDLDMITASATPLWINKDADVDVAITIDDGRTHVVVGDEIQYTLTVTNFGPDDVSDVVLSQGIDEGLTDVRWTSVTSGGATSELSGEGAVGETVSLPVGASVVYTIDARIIFKAEGTVETWFSAQVPARSHDLNPRDNRINDTNAVWQSTTHGRSFAPEPVLELEGDASDSSLVDIDGDGDIDIVSAVSQGIAVYRNDGFMNFTRSSYGRSGVIAGLDTGDVDRDGDIDVLTSRGLWLNNGIGQLTASPYPLPVATNVGLADLDSDGDLDAVLGGAQASIYVNDGSGRFSSRLCLVSSCGGSVGSWRV